MPNWISADEAIRYFGINPEEIEELERIVVEHHIDVELDEYDFIVRVDADDCKAALFKEHEYEHGYRPDDVGQMALAKQEHEKHEVEKKKRRREKRMRLANRVSMRS
jgi:hypothetical protein